MKKILFCAVALVVLAAAMGGCSSESVAVPSTHAPFSLPTLIPPTRIPPTPTALPTASPSPTPTIQQTAAAKTGAATQRTPSPTLASRTVSPVPVISPTSAVARGVYVTGLRTDPPPVRGPELKFYAMFLNAMEREQNYRWEVFIFRVDTQRQIGETTRTDSAIPLGAIERQSNGSWRLPLGGPCDYYYAQVGWFTSENKIVWFTTPSGSIFQKGLAVCPP